MNWKLILTVFLSLHLLGCAEKEQVETGRKTSTQELWVKMLVEIPAGTIEKYELNKSSGILQMDSVDGKPRLIDYLGYPANYGMIPNTILPKSEGGDGDPLDIIAIGPPAARGSIIDCKVIGVLKLKDRGEQDDKLIAILRNSSLQHIKSILELQKKYPGISEIIETWFTNYKGNNAMISEGYQDQKLAQDIYSTAKAAYVD
ncbi:inorganic diphosphatase [Vicingaceae bacterium]|nr:inorganic diphosphatase [Vicingaceae bacterium]MDC1451386.1 inorganic diphosphatase [Vicingaceae bacterium]